ncbi:hypothetical protein AWZ03_000296 [Drosophila navojoa]|uniref:Uncharacterized protein n=1 Tax=Drosophila navojoa TaxID=7232 RepID=A0A484C3E8_DRONA|nr:hypothetical protein AWZ03_000296 [Drosophila navojoa]
MTEIARIVSTGDADDAVVDGEEEEDDDDDDDEAEEGPFFRPLEQGRIFNLMTQTKQQSSLGRSKANQAEWGGVNGAQMTSEWAA